MKAERIFEIAKKVYEAYPVTRKEKQGCPTAKEKNDGLRFERVKRIVEDETAEKVVENGNEGKETIVSMDKLKNFVLNELT